MPHVKIETVPSDVIVNVALLAMDNTAMVTEQSIT
jgi:hypothetical protein